MEDTITTTYCICEEFLKAVGHRDDPQARLSVAEVMTIPLVAAAFFGGNIEMARSFLDEYGYIHRRRSQRAASTGGSARHRPLGVGGFVLAFVGSIQGA